MLDVGLMEGIIFGNLDHKGSFCDPLNVEQANSEASGRDFMSLAQGSTSSRTANRSPTILCYQESCKRQLYIGTRRIRWYVLRKGLITPTFLLKKGWDWNPLEPSILFDREGSGFLGENL